MQQTILALGALLILVTLTVNQQRSIFLVQRGAYLRELESAAADYGEARLRQIAETMAFDEQRVGMTVIDTNTGDLTPDAAFGPDGTETFATFDDLDDFDGYVETDVTHTLSDEQYRFRATYNVRYVDPENPDPDPNGIPAGNTLAKEIMVLVESFDPLTSVDDVVARVVVKKVVTISDYAS